jgi:uncharacterized protein (DUF305 family)
VNTVIDRTFVGLLLLSSAGAASCAASSAAGQAPIVRPGAPGQPARAIGADEAASHTAPGYTAADARFMQGMIGHHAQALEMTELLKTRSTDPDMRKLALRIELSQADEIRMMQEWLRVRGEALPDPHAHHMHGATLMPGMLTEEQMTRLAGTNGREFDRLFLELMISHHDGALVMVKELFETPGAGQESEIFAFASDVDADQRMEIARMGAMLRERQK